MFGKILIAVDGSSCSERAGRVGLAFARGLGAEVWVVHVVKAPPAYLEAGAGAAEAESWAEALLGSWRELGRRAGLEPRTEALRHDHAGEGIAEAAGRLGCELVVLGTHGREGLRRVLLGSVAERVCRLSPVPVLLVRGDGGVEPATGAFGRILTPVDGSAAAEAAFRVADRLAVRLGAELQVLHVVPPLAVPLPEPWGGATSVLYAWAEIERALEQEEHAILAAAQARACAARVTTASVKAGHRREADCIVEYARDNGTDLIVMGTHGRTGLERLLLGSVAEGVAHHTPVPLLLVRPGQAGGLEAALSPGREKEESR